MARASVALPRWWVCPPLVAIALAACEPAPEQLPPLGEILVVVDTDAPSKLVSRLRVDVFRDDGVWLDTRDLSMARPEDWPGSFSVFVAEGDGARSVLVRLRAYPEGRVRDYLGERYAHRPAETTPPDAFAPAPPLGDGAPRLVVDGVDLTPAREPTPGTAIDRLAVFELAYGQRRSSRVTLHAACFGTMADLAGEKTCVELEDALLPVDEPPTSGDMTVPRGDSAIGTAGGDDACTVAPRAATAAADGTPLFDDEVCVGGGWFALGSIALVTGSPNEEIAAGSVPPDFGAVPERIAHMPPMLVDRHEVTVARWRHAVDVEGFVSPDPSPQPNDAPYPTTFEGTPPQAFCTYSTAPIGRERHPVNCITWRAARALCRHWGADLLTEAQWEYAATAAGREAETSFPWGNAPPSCDRSVYGRADDPAGSSYDDCIGEGFGPVGVDAPAALADVTPGGGVLGLAGNVSEHVLDAYLSYGTLCWSTQRLFDPRCVFDHADYHARRGGEWTDRAGSLRAAARSGLLDGDVVGLVGFRCARPGR